MKTLIGGAIAFVVGVIGIVVWIKAFLQLLAGAVPAVLLLGGCLAIYLGFDELKDSWKKDDDVEMDDGKETKINELKQEIKTLKKDKDEDKQYPFEIEK